MARDARPSAVAMVGRPPGMLTLTPADPAAAQGTAATAFACRAVCVVWGSAVAALRRVLPLSFGCLASLTQLLSSALRLAPRLAELPLCLPEFALEALQQLRHSRGEVQRAQEELR